MSKRLDVFTISRVMGKSESYIYVESFACICYDSKLIYLGTGNYCLVRIKGIVLYLENNVNTKNMLTQEFNAIR